jgi:glucose-1-phosphate adenylyltransferase
MLRDHLQHGADITLAVLPCSEAEIGGFGAVRVDSAGRVVEFREKPRDEAARGGMQTAPALMHEHGIEGDRPYLASMGIYLFRKEVLRRVLDNELSDFGHDVIPAAVEKGLVCAHFFRGYWRDIGTIRAFFDAHMDLVRPDTPFDFFDSNWPIYTHPRNLPGSRITNCEFRRTVLAGGAILSDCKLDESVVGVRSVVRGSTVRRSLIMGSDPQEIPSEIRRGTVIENAIIDKNVNIGEGVRIVNASGVSDAVGPNWFIRDGIVVIPHNTVIPDGTTI